MRIAPWNICLSGLALLAAVQMLQAQPDKAPDHNRVETDRTEAVIAGDYFGTGATSEPNTVIEGDAFITGGEVILRTTVKGDAVLAGGAVHMDSRVGSDLYATGGSVVVSGEVGHNARLAGGRVQVTPDGDIAGKVTAAGSDVRVQGRVGGALVVFADSVMIDAVVNGGAAIVARHLEVGPNARVNGRLTYRTARAPQISAQAVITGGIRQSELQAFPGKKLEHAARTAIWVGASTFTAGLIIVAVLIVLLAPHASASVVRQLRSRPILSTLIGLALIVCIPLGAILAMVTVVGIPLGSLLLFMFPVVALLGYLVGAMFLGDALASLTAGAGRDGPGRAARVTGSVVVLIALTILSCLFPIGALVILLLLFCGTGALFITFRNIAFRGEAR